MKEALYYEKLDDKKVKCNLCHRHCIIPEGEFGVCGARRNIDGVLYSLTYGRPISINLDPIEKKPLYHFYPGETTLSLGTLSCNFKCKHCQNWEISQARADMNPNPYTYKPEDIIELARENKSWIISYTYNEPTVFYEYAIEIMKLAKETKTLFKKFRNVWVTNGYIEKEPLKELCKYLDAANVDIKCFSEKVFRELTSASGLRHILGNVKYMFEQGIHIELTYLIIPGLNDDDLQLTAFCEWVKKELSLDVPIHFNRFHPDYKMIDVPETPVETLKRAYSIAKSKGLRYVYIGNIYLDRVCNTYCPNCGALLIDRFGFVIKNIGIKDGKCTNCGFEIYGRF